MPADITLAFSACGFSLKHWVERARAACHEILLTLPMEGHDFPLQDPGPLGLLTSLSRGDNRKRLEAVLAHATGSCSIPPRGPEAQAIVARAVGPASWPVPRRSVSIW
ncbi:MAG: hypothetical protein FD153_1422 [Rhodospirillaceae bacterium]|nr:MAG: hypothetical protein FD153_1422 [Rhodospirillaceae bacterium]